MYRRWLWDVSPRKWFELGSTGLVGVGWVKERPRQKTEHVQRPCVSRQPGEWASGCHLESWRDRQSLAGQGRSLSLPYAQEEAIQGN